MLNNPKTQANIQLHEVLTRNSRVKLIKLFKQIVSICRPTRRTAPQILQSSTIETVDRHIDLSSDTNA